MKKHPASLPCSGAGWLVGISELLVANVLVMNAPPKTEAMDIINLQCH
jgi:hypothetical protein